MATPEARTLLKIIPIITTTEIHLITRIITTPAADITIPELDTTADLTAADIMAASVAATAAGSMAAAAVMAAAIINRSREQTKSPVRGQRNENMILRALKAIGVVLGIPLLVISLSIAMILSLIVVGSWIMAWLFGSMGRC